MKRRPLHWPPVGLLVLFEGVIREPSYGQKIRSSWSSGKARDRANNITKSARQIAMAMPIEVISSPFSLEVDYLISVDLTKCANVLDPATASLYSTTTNFTVVPGLSASTLNP